MNYIRLSCCTTMREASGECTDNEEYGRAVYFNGKQAKIGSIGRPITFCPWCGFRMPVYEENEVKGDK